ncbi:hypothetical protein AX16_001999 [Volvariella volvacea WC 439]|nr:hypothetical protein AX16_001999 [Volvariella volvacea WC 439]
MSRSNRGRGRGRGRGGRGGGGEFMGRGMGGGRGRGGRGFRGGGWGRGGPPSLRGDADFFDNGMDFVIQQWPANNGPARGSRGRGSGPSTPGRSGSNTPRGRGRPPPTRGTDSPRARGRGDGGNRGGRGGGRGNKALPNAPLSQLLAEDRPYLRPIIFVRSIQTPFLFRVEEEIFRPVAEEVGDGEVNHVPTADRVFKVFSGSADAEDTEASTEEQEAVEEIDFADLGRIQAEVDAAAARGASKKNAELIEVEERFTGIRISSITTNDPTPGAPDDTALATTSVSSMQVEISEASTPGVSTETTAAQTASVPETTTQTTAEEPKPTEEPLGFFIDTNPTQPTTAGVTTSQTTNPLGGDDKDDDDDIIVYVAPHPRSGSDSHPQREPTPQPLPLPTTSILTGLALGQPAQPQPQPQLSSSDGPPTTGPSEPPADASLQTPVPAPEELTSPPPIPPIPSPPPFSSVQFSFAETPSASAPAPTKKTTRQTPTFVVGSRAKAKAKARMVERKRRSTQRPVFGSYGAMMEEAQLHESGQHTTIRWVVGRRGDSDLDWGDEDEDGKDEEGGAGAGADGVAEGMSLDPDLEMDIGAMKAFVTGMGPSGGAFVTMDDIADQRKLEEEDNDVVWRGVESEESDEDEDDEELDAAVNEEEEQMVADDDDDPLLSSDDDMDPRASFQARLDRIRRNARGKRKEDNFVAAELMDLDDDDDDDDEDFDEDEDLINNIEGFLDRYSDTLESHDRKHRNDVFRAINTGSFDLFENLGQTSKKKKDRYTDLPDDLQAQWEKDRAKKAEHKRLRALERLRLASDPFAAHKGGKKGKKAMLAASRLDPTITVLPNRVIDMVGLVQQIRRWIADLGGPQSMALPPADKGTRKRVHELANAFGLKSVSKGKGEARYTTLMKTSRTGVSIDERAIGRIVRRGTARGGGSGFLDDDDDDEGGGRAFGRGKKGKRGGTHRDGDTVGKEAPKIGEENVGFRMLASMGWAEGDMIGLSGGIDEPLTAIIKKTKLGLGATR